jgi:hypothetical protein
MQVKSNAILKKSDFLKHIFKMFCTFGHFCYFGPLVVVAVMLLVGAFLVPLEFVHQQIKSRAHYSWCYFSSSWLLLFSQEESGRISKFCMGKNVGDLKTHALEKCHLCRADYPTCASRIVEV